MGFWIEITLEIQFRIRGLEISILVLNIYDDLREFDMVMPPGLDQHFQSVNVVSVALLQ